MNMHTSATTFSVSEALDRDPTYAAIVGRLSEMSVRKAHDPYRDVGWDDPELRIEPNDPRLCIDPEQPLAKTTWHKQLDDETRARFGAAWLAQTLKYAVGFEAVLSRGLLIFAAELGNRTPDFRYVMHEVIEESRHSQMFQELIDRIADSDPPPLAALDRFFDDRVAMTARYFPELFFLSVLGGEIFIDRQNRDELRRPKGQVHPLIRRVIQIHVTEEARHVCFAHSYLNEHLPRLGAGKRALLKLLAPLLLGEPARMMLQPSAALVKRFAIPKSALHEAYGPGTEHRALLQHTVEPVRALAEAHGFWWPRAWQRFGLAAR